jgi:hypothetical protein
MRTPSPIKGPPSLLRTTFRRSLALGRIFIIVGIVYVLVLAVALSFTAASSFTSAYPIFLPIFAVLGSMGGLMVFSNDRTKGVFEYLIAYGISPRRLFINVLLVSLLLETVVLGLVLGIGLGIFVASGHAISLALVMALAVYSVPMSYASAAFAATVGMFWTSLSSPRSGLNSPIGLVPFVGIAPSILTLALVSFLAIEGFTDIYLVIGVAVGAVVALVLLLLSLLDRLMPRERLLSPV